MFALGVASRWGWGEGGVGGGGSGGGANNATHYSTALEYIHKRILPVHIITNNQQMANKLLHVLFPYKVSKITQH